MKFCRQYLLLVLVLPLLFAFSGRESKDYTYKTIFIYNFIKYIEWPSAHADFTIAIYQGNDDVQDAFKQMALKKSGTTQSYTIKNISNLNEASTAQVLFIPNEQSAVLPEAAALAKEKPVLIVTEKDGLIKRGSGINFIVVDGKLRFELNRKSLDAAGLKVSSSLLNLAILV